MKTITEYSTLFDGLKVNGSLRRLGKLFQTENCNYLYDLGTGKILTCTSDEYAVLKYIFEHDGINGIADLEMDSSILLKTLKEIEETIKNEHILQAPPLKEFSSFHNNMDSVKEMVGNHLQQITLELTERCNLRCKYCIYTEENETFRNFNTHDMTWNIAKKAIDYGLEHSEDDLAITFYGGEPLIQWELVKKCVEYSQKVGKDKKIRYSMTTNMTLMTKEIAEYLATISEFSVVCSLDGPEEIHNENRVTIDGTGSFDNAIRGLKYLVDAYKERSSLYLSLSMVMTLPATTQKLEKIQTFFENLSWLPTKVVKNISYVASSKNRDDRILKNDVENSVSQGEYVNPIADWSQDLLVNNDKLRLEQIYTNSFMQSSFLKIHKRMIVDEPVGCYNLSGCCIPAARRLYITALGKFLLCEKIGNAPYIGDIDNGIDMCSIEKHYINDFIDESKKLCAECWAIRLCGNCYVDCYDNNGFRADYKKDRCGAALYGIEKELIAYQEMFEKHPEQLEYLNSITLG